MAIENPFVNSPMNFNRAAPTGANIPSFGLPQNHTLAIDPFNQQAQMLSMGMPVAAFDASGGNNGYFSQAMMNASPLMQNYSGNGLYSSNFLANGLGMGMPGWQSNGNGSFTAGQYNPFAAINYNYGRTVEPNLNQGSGAPPWLSGQQQKTAHPSLNPGASAPGLVPGQQVQRPATQRPAYNPVMATAPQTQLRPYSPVVPGTNMNQREYETMQFDGPQATQQHYNNLSQQSQAALRTRSILGGDPMSADVLSQGAGAPSGSMASTGYVNPAVLAFAKKHPDSLQAQKVASVLGANWNQG